MILRRRTKRRGDLIALITEILESVNLKDVEATGPVGVRQRSATTVKLPKTLHTKLKRTALERSVSMNALLNGAVLQHFGKQG